MGNISVNFSMDEFSVSARYPDLAKKLIFTDFDQFKARYLVHTILQPIRSFFHIPIHITSGKRSPNLNKALGGAPNSDHLWRDGSCACDFVVGENPQDTLKAYDFIRQTLPFAFGQMILYYQKKDVPKHLHVSLPTSSHQGEIFEMSPDKILIRLPNETKEYAVGNA